MGYWFKQEWEKSRRWIFVLGFCVVLIAFSYAVAYDEHYNEDSKSLLFAIRLGGYLVGGSLLAALVVAAFPLVVWAFCKITKRNIVESQSAEKIFKYFRTVLWLEIALGLFAGFLLGEKFLAGPKALVGWLIEVAANIKGLFV